MIKLERSFLKALRERYDLRDLVHALHPDLAPLGDELTGCCPFHSENTASFRVSQHRYHCFGCGVHGDLFSWVMQQEGLSFKEAVEMLAKDLVIEHTPEEKAPASSPYPAIEILNEYEAHEADQRGFLDEVNYDATSPQMDYLASRVPMWEQDLGIDYRTNRITIPLWSHNGKYLLGHVKRLIPGFGDGQRPKYTNPKNASFVRKRYLFNLSHISPKTKQIIVVEGIFDALSLRWAGISNVVATMGTSVSPQQLALLDRFERVTFLFDGDLPGLSAVARLAPYSLSSQAHYQAVLLSDIMDPDSVSRQFGYNKEHITAYLKAMPKVDFAHFLTGKIEFGGDVVDRSLLDKLAKPYVDANVAEGWPQYNVVDWVMQAYPQHGPAIKAAALRLKDGMTEESVKAFLKEWIKPSRDVRRAHKAMNGQQ